MTDPPWPPDVIARDLRELGLGDGDTVMVHASMRAIGSVIGGADGVIDALDAVLGASGTSVMNLGAVEGVPFDPLTTPADPDVGVLAEAFRRRSGTVVSDHPDARFGARGAAATHLTDGVPWNDYYGPGSSLARLVSLDARVLRLGSDLDTVTMIHLAEYLADVPDKRRVHRRHRVVGPDGTVRVREVECLDDSDGIVDHPGEDYFATITRDYLATGRARVGRVGAARSELIQARDLVEFATAWMNEHLGPR
ncbi:MAG: aminoglycoside N3-acetyltransferase [Ilumatobacteraceae bacterium]|nr:aminoglycoside N3-acetyltransferase [Ilumatobacteraceae bacterium]MCU1390904.1 aminoglycoside N3-acetyltransferase [Ilumatobacteraceae bacterium]